MDLKVCRVCGGFMQLKTILEDDDMLINKLLVCVNIKIDSRDLLPKFICEQCDKNLDICYRLKKQCEDTQKRLKSAMQSNQNTSLQMTDLPTEESFTEYSECEQVDLSQYSDDSFESVNMDDSGNKKEVLMHNTNANQINSYYQNIIIEEPNLRNATFEKKENVSCINNDILTNESGISCATKVKERIEISIASEYCSIDLLSSSGSSTCDGCDDSTNQEAENKIADTNALTCDTCNEAFTNNQDYRIHIKHHGLKRFQCIQCCKFFPSRFRLKRHEEIHRDTPTTHQCSYCNRNYRALCNLERHIRSAHIGTKNWECSVCNVSFSRTDALKRHLLLHSDEKKYMCSSCSQRFKTKDYLYAHHKSHHAEKSDLPKINKRIRKDNGKKNQCGYCGKLFTSSFAFKNHLLIHANEKPHTCEVCNKSFRTIAALSIHQRIHDDYRPYQCDLCLKSFRQTSHLKEHRALHLDDASKHVCSVCNASFAKKSNLKAHTKIHVKEKEFQCADCSAEFSSMHLLKRHASTVHCRSVNEVYTLNDIDDACEIDDQTKNDILQNEMYHYIDTVADANCNEFENIDILSSGLQEIFSPQAEPQISYNENCAASSCKPILGNEGMHSFNFLQTQSTDENVIEEINYNESDIREQKVDILVTEETKLTSALLNVYGVE